MSLGSEAMSQRRFKIAIEEFTRAQKAAERYGSTLEKFENQTALACALAADKQYLEAEQVYLNALDRCDNGIERYPAAMCMCSLAHVYKEMREFEKSRSFALRALTIFETEICEEPAVLFVPLTLLADLSLTSGDRDQAIYFVSKARLIAERYPGQKNLEFMPEIREMEAKLAATIVVSTVESALRN